MKEPRHIKVLLEIILNYLVKYKIIGICYTVYNLLDDEVITKPEYKILNRYIDDNKPIKQYYDDCGEPTDDDTQFWYKPYNLRYRIMWLEKHIKLNSK